MVCSPIRQTLGLPSTPMGEKQKAEFPYYCPLCMWHYKLMLKSVCCGGNYICGFCLSDLVKRGGSFDNMGRSGSRHIETGVACPFCADPLVVTEVLKCEKARSYDDEESAKVPAANSVIPECSPMHLNDSYGTLRRKMVPFPSINVPFSPVTPAAFEDRQPAVAVNLAATNPEFQPTQPQPHSASPSTRAALQPRSQPRGIDVRPDADDEVMPRGAAAAVGNLSVESTGRPVRGGGPAIPARRPVLSERNNHGRPPPVPEGYGSAGVRRRARRGLHFEAIAVTPTLTSAPSMAASNGVLPVAINSIVIPPRARSASLGGNAAAGGGATNEGNGGGRGRRRHSASSMVRVIQVRPASCLGMFFHSSDDESDSVDDSDQNEKEESNRKIPAKRGVEATHRHRVRPEKPNEREVREDINSNIRHHCIIS